MIESLLDKEGFNLLKEILVKLVLVWDNLLNPVLQLLLEVVDYLVVVLLMLLFHFQVELLLLVVDYLVVAEQL